MEQHAMQVLLVGNIDGEAAHLREQLENRGCRCWFARSSDEVISLVDRHCFDLILSTTWVPDRLLGKLADAESTLYFSYPVRNGCWWLPVLRRGERCLGDPAMRPKEFSALIHQVTKNAQRINATATQPRTETSITIQLTCETAKY